MINIVLLDVLSEEYRDGLLDYADGMIPNDEFKLICDMDDADRSIYVLPHEKSLLRECFLQSHINSDGYIDKDSYGKEFCVSVNGREFRYTITKGKSAFN